MSRRVAVIGGGIVGLSSALYLRRAGAEVTLYDRALPAQETSIWNAGVLATSSLVPLANPSIFRRLPAILAGRAAGAQIDWRAVRDVLPWGLRFLAASRSGPSLRSTEALHALITRSRRCHEVLLGLAGAGELLHTNGWLFLYRSPQSLAAAAASGTAFDRFGVRREIIDEARLRQIEPALRGAFAGAVLFPDSAAVTDPRQVMTTYHDLLRRNGGVTRECQVERAGPTAQGWRIATASEQEGPFDDVVIAAGAWTNRLLATFARLPLIVERGYLRRYALSGTAALRHPVYDVEGGYVLSPRPEGVQLSTGAEFTRLDACPRLAMFEEAERRAQFALELGPPFDPTPAVGNRPSLPDCLPAIGPVSGQAGLWVATGHQHVGFSTGPATGELIGDLVLGRPSALDPRPFSPARFGV